MSVSTEPRLDVAELRRLLQAADPAAVLVPPRVLRRVIKHDRKLTGIGLQVPHRKSYVIGREALLGLADRDELGVESEHDLPPTLLLIACPEPERLIALPRGLALVKFWRLLFHARVHQVIASRLADGRLTEAGIRERIRRIGQIEFDEIRTVLRQEKYLLPPRDDSTVYEEFAALYLDLSFFAPTLLPRYFPAVEDFGQIDRILAEDLDAPDLYAGSRLAGAPDPVFTVDDADGADQSGPDQGGAVPIIAPAAATEKYGDLMTRADRAAAIGNSVRAAIYLTRAAGLAAAEAGEAQARVEAELDRLVERLQRALHLDDAEAQAWRLALPALLPRTAREFWPAEARLLYDLQKICVGHERPVYSASLVEWAYSRFSQPLVRPLPDQPLVLALKHLRSAGARLPSIRVSEDERHALSVAVRSTLRHAEERLREHFRPLLADVLHEVGLRPLNFPERIARDKLVAELLDRIADRGFLTLGDLRDALSRNQLKLPDLSGPGEFLRGDPLLRANRELAVRVAGVYRRGEVYLRWLQRGSALAFGTRVGRLLTLHLFLPFGGAFLAIEGPFQIVHEVEKLTGFLKGLLFGAPEHTAGHAHASFPLAPWLAILLGGVFFWLLLHVQAVRTWTGQMLGLVGRGLRAMSVDLPAAVLRWPALRLLLDSRPFALFVGYVIKPLVPAVLTWVVLAQWGLDPGGAAACGGVMFVAAFLFLNSRLGRNLEEITADWAARRWEYLRDFVPGLFRLVADAFKRLLGGADRALYTVDEWLRFRSGDGRLTLVWKTVAGLLWRTVAYVLRILLVLFIEPQINPIKHFPVVTISHKLLLPMIPALTEFLRQAFGMGMAAAGTVATIIIGKIPGFFGFLVWELKENWRLYRANRPRSLRPAVIGHHGETMLRLLKPGFHSGTLPKLYAKLRRAERRAHRSGNWRASRRLRQTIHHVEECVRRFAERDLLAYLNGSKGWAAGPVHLGTVEAGSNRIRVELACPKLGTPDLELKLEARSGWLLAHVSRPGWLPRLSPDQGAVLALALTGFYKESGVDLVAEQIEASLRLEDSRYDIADQGLVVWPGSAYEVEVVYDLRAGPVLHPHTVSGQAALELPSLEAGQLLFSRRDVTWEDWVDAWERDQTGKAPPGPVVPSVRVLPPAPKIP